MKKEYTLVLVIGLFLLSYVLEAVITPLPRIFSTPFQFLSPTNLQHYPFTAFDIAVKSLAIFLTPLLILSLFNGMHLVKGIILLILSGLLQLYALQDVASHVAVVPVEWSISFAVAGAALIIPTAIHIILGLFHKTKERLGGKVKEKELSPEPKSE